MTMIAGNEQASGADGGAGDGGREQDAVRLLQLQAARAMWEVLAYPLPTVLWKISDIQVGSMPHVVGQIHRGTSAPAQVVAYEALLEWAEALQVPTQVHASTEQHPFTKVWIRWVDDGGIIFELWMHAESEAWATISGTEQ